MKLYAYCVTENLDALNEASRGISGAEVRLIKLEDFGVLVSDCDGDVFPVTVENVLAHDAIVRSVSDQTTPLPFRFGTLVTEQQLRNYVSAHKPALKTKLAHLRGRVEMNLRVTWQLTTNKPPESEQAGEPGTGTRFLLEKRRQLLGDDLSVAEKAELSKWLRDYVSDLICDEKISLRPSPTVLLAKVDHLVEQANLQEYREKLAEALQKRPELHFLVSGPWPPYSFANIDLEFQTQFGVS
jgi:Gas vesicle synthesis protein GvpL/GvpF